MRQFIVTYPEGHTIDAEGIQTSNMDMAGMLVQGLIQGGSCTIPSTWSIVEMTTDRDEMIEAMKNIYYATKHIGDMTECRTKLERWVK